MLDVIKLGIALPPVVGKTIERIFLVPLADHAFQIHLVFTDETYYEWYGTVTPSGGPVVDSGTVGAVREISVHNSGGALEVGPWGTRTPHVLRAYQDGRRMLIEANANSGGVSIVSLLPGAPTGVRDAVVRVIERAPSTMV